MKETLLVRAVNTVTMMQGASFLIDHFPYGKSRNITAERAMMETATAITNRSRTERLKMIKVKRFHCIPPS
jgi:hypothetical protein